MGVVGRRSLHRVAHFPRDVQRVLVELADQRRVRRGWLGAGGVAFRRLRAQRDRWRREGLWCIVTAPDGNAEVVQVLEVAEHALTAPVNGLFGLSLEVRVPAVDSSL